KDFQIFPNPATDNISVKTPFNNCNINIYDNLGQLVRQIEVNDKIINIDVSNFTNGIYNFIIISDNNQLIKKISILK
ncbi:MAG: T9SS type A sorting domain-containing protein, partial [Bacteroidota bacterium]